jgi:hypothetical protein
MTRRLLFVVMAAALAGFASTPAATADEDCDHGGWVNIWLTVPYGANDFDIVVEGNYNPTWLFPPGPTVTHSDVDADGDPDTLISWHFPTGQAIHDGINVPLGLPIEDAYWTHDGERLAAASIAKTQLHVIRPDSGPSTLIWQVQASGNSGTLLDLRNIRTFKDVPKGVLSPETINSDLDLSTLSAYEVTPSAQNLTSLPTDGFSDVNIGTSGMVGAYYQSLLVGDLYYNGEQVGISWSLADECPEPSSLVLLGIGAVSLLAYVWRRR